MLVLYEAFLSLNKVSGPLGMDPYINSKGAKPVVSCGTSRYANNAHCKSLSQAVGLSKDNFLNHGFDSSIRSFT